MRGGGRGGDVMHQPIICRGSASLRRGAAAADNAGPGARAAKWERGREALVRERPAERRGAGRRTGAVPL